jgi:ligand-binding sensor domain-containing protein
MITQWLPKDGLPQSTITSIAQSEDGYIWFGTQEGLVRFDGIKFFVFEHGKDVELQNFNISVICKGPMNKIYIGTFNKGLFIFENNDFLKVDEKSGLPEKMMNCMTGKNGKRIWIGTSHGIYYIENRKVFSPSPLAYLKTFNIKALFEDKDGNLFIGTENDGIFFLLNQ